jgi:hypothetical protein
MTKALASFVGDLHNVHARVVRVRPRGDDDGDEERVEQRGM